jgi:D-glycero-D-manno-heptose 1,7-bisphosphate phosphatase
MKLDTQTRALFLDRDGVLIDYIPYLCDPDRVSIPDGAPQALYHWQAAGYLLIVVTNQSGIGRGLFTWADLEAVHQRMADAYTQSGVHFTEILVCPHHPQAGCTCRKPSPEMIQQAAQRYCIDLERSFFIGDNLSDLECARNAGCQAVLVLTGLGKVTQKSLEEEYRKVPVFSNLHHTVQLL